MVLTVVLSLVGNTDSAHTSPVKVVPARFSDGLPERPLMTITSSAPSFVGVCIGVVQSHATGDVADRVHDPVADLLRVAQPRGQPERSDRRRRVEARAPSDAAYSV